ncbi:MAG: cysteine peptidase family C39 domain-containing protein [Thermoplasmata archaeon]
MGKKRLLLLLILGVVRLYGFDENITPVGSFNPFSKDTKEFNEALNLWNSHQWKKAKEKFENLIRKYPESPWVIESKFHLGCLSFYEKNYTKAERIFKEIESENKNTPFANKTKIRLSNVYIEKGDYEKALEKLKEVLENNPTSSQFKYAFGWYRHLKTYQIASKRAQLCGPRTLAYSLKILGKENEANQLLSLKSSEKPYSMNDLINLAKKYGFEAYGVKIPVSKLKEIKKPIILYLKDKSHFVVVQDINDSKITIIDPFKGKLEKDMEELKNEWKGEAIIFTKIDRRYLLTKKQMDEYKGGCCGRVRIYCLGDSCDCGGDDVQPGGSPGCSNCNGNPSPGANPSITVNSASLNLRMLETPIGYKSSRGPSVLITLSYNSDDPESGYFGNGWSSLLDIRLYEQPDNSVLIKMDSGNQSLYLYDNGNYISPSGRYTTLIKNPDNTFLLIEKSKTKYYFGENQKIKKIEDKNGNYITFNYDNNDRPVEIIDSFGRTTTISYNDDNLISSITDPIGRTAYFIYDTNKNLVEIIDMGGYSLSINYDAQNRIISYTTPLGTTNISYETPFWQMYKIKITTPNGKTTIYYWDGSGFTQGANIITTPMGKQTWYFVDWQGNVSEKLEAIIPVEIPEDGPFWGPVPDGYHTYFSYDGNRNLISKTDPLGNTYNYSYDGNGNLISSTDPYGNTTTYTYDSNGNLTSITDPLGRTTYFSYDSNGNLISKTDPLGNTYNYTYNSYGQLIQIKDPKNNITTYEYDDYGNLTKIIDPVGNQTQFTYDILGRKISETNAKGKTTYYTYDSMDRITQITFPDNSTITYTYNCCGVSSITDQNGKTTYYTYDNMLNLIKITDANGNQTNYTYDDDGRLSSIQDANGNITTFTYDYLGRLIRKTYPDGSYEQYEYDGNNNLIKKIKPDGKTINYTYDRLNRLIEIRAQ